ncbi:MAG: Uncharacterised protein [Synechococcus sp. CC9902]|nr:MAG: Uncharacterised protein [Synechococcus sp. CC9902]
MTTTTAPEFTPSLRERLLYLLLNATDSIRLKLISQLGGEYALQEPEPVLDVSMPGTCWIVQGRHGQTLVSRSLPIWDVDAVDRDADDETLIDLLRDELERTAPNDLFRIYRTRGGLRVICTSRAVDLNDRRDWAWFTSRGEKMGADPIYLKLCRQQRTCRARLDPKQSRHGLEAPANARACRLISDDIGSGTAAPELMAQVEVHDRATRALFDHERELF